MKPGNFSYVRAETLNEAISALQKHGDAAKLLAGGQSLIPMMNFRMAAPDVLVDIGRISDLDFIRMDGDTLVIGAGTRHAAILSSDLVRQACPLLVEAYEDVAHPTIRNRGTIGGNVCHHDPASEVPLVLTLVDASLELVGPDGSRTVSADGFFLDTMETAIADNEVLTEIRIPRQGAGDHYAFVEVSPRKGNYAIVGAGCRFGLSGGNFSNVRLGFIGAGTHIKRIAEAEAALEGRAATDEVIAAAADVAAEKAEPSEDAIADVDYKRDLVKTLGARVVKSARDRSA